VPPTELADLRRADENGVVRQLDDVHDGKAGDREVERLMQSLGMATSAIWKAM
jgi:hypothetical protein